MAEGHGPAQVAFAVANLVMAVEVEMQLADVGVQLGKVALQVGQAVDLVQRVAEADVIAVQLAEAVQVVRVELGELAGELVQVVRHERPPVAADS